MIEWDAYHEAGHAFAATYFGAAVMSVTITPANDDGPARTGDTRVAWEHALFPPADLARRMALVALAGPVAEMLYRDEQLHPGFVPEWSTDWRHAWDAMAASIPDERKRLARLERSLFDLRDLVNRDHIWAAVAEIADQLLTHEYLEQAEVDEIVRIWCEPESH
jgi:hypothetical protein